MDVQVKSATGIKLVPIETRLLAERKIFIESEIDTACALRFVKQMMYLNIEDGEAPIDVFVNSPGGEIWAGMMMYDAIQSSEAPVRMNCIGRAYSMGALLFASGLHGRYMLPDARLMIHEPMLTGRIDGNSSSVKSISESILQTKEKMNRILSKHTGRTEAEIEEATAYDHYLEPAESIAFGLCDAVVDFAQMIGRKTDV